MPSVRVNSEDVEGAIRRLKRLSERAGILSELRKKRMHYIKRAVQRQADRAAAVKRHLRKLQREMPQPRDKRAARYFKKS